MDLHDSLTMAIPRVYWQSVPPKAGEELWSRAARRVLESLAEQEHLTLEKHIPIKLHFGEKGNRTYLKPAVYDGIIDFLQERGIVSEFTESCVLYGGERFTREKHEKLAVSHGFTRLPVVIADGERGEAAQSVEVGQKHFQSCAIAEKLAAAPQVLVVSHFKGHALAGFGGALKQLSMGFAAKGGKMAMHAHVRPVIRSWFCKKCGLCVKRCQMQAISLGKRSAEMDKSKCIGCGACYAVCPSHAVSVWSLKGICNALFHRNEFRERLAEYALASSRGKKHIYLNFAVNITPGCDCEPRPMFRSVPDIGIFASLDPVAADAACFDAVRAGGKFFKGESMLDYAQKIGVGSRKYELTEIQCNSFLSQTRASSCVENAPSS